MHFCDAVYGPVTLTEPVFTALLESPALARLQGVLQHGITGLIGLRSRTTRLEHSLGTLALVRRLGGNLEEQVAALLHDVSHTAFSHVVDYLYDLPNGQSYHEAVKERIVAASALPGILARFGYSVQEVMAEEHYSLLEQPAPRLCADRLDYFLRDSLDLGLATPARVQATLAHLVVHQGRIGVDDLATARFLGDAYIAADGASWSNLKEVGLYELTARALRIGLRLGALSEADLWTGDEAVWCKLAAHEDSDLQAVLRLIRPDTQFFLDPDAPSFSVIPKVRTIDPDVLLGGAFQPLSILDPAFAHRRREYVLGKQGAWPIRVKLL